MKERTGKQTGNSKQVQRQIETNQIPADIPAEITVYETVELYGERGRFRVLQFGDGAVQGAMDINRPERIILEYPRAMLHLLEHNVPDYDKVFMIGLGAGTLAAHLKAAGRQVLVAEIDERVADISRSHFGYIGCSVRIGDGQRILEEQPAAGFDGMIIDAFTEKGTPRHLISSPFFGLAAEKLRPEGIILLNVFGRGKHDELTAAIVTTLQVHFAYVRVFSLPAEHTHDKRNMVIAGSRQPIGYDRRHLAGFVEIEVQEGYIIRDRSW
ncbi:spermidine synthase [Paenibacillus macerans]|uniref:spermidine synthase n=1 Tax=Paenibacillus macerans TaxID=44252 RepID=UPI00203C3BEB|nr:fused MFS/spermidine synthase [Paenibacillus macerans]MCM3700797.1 fused MFS/spermidine synthase [Paenibacillus macerans]